MSVLSARMNQNANRDLYAEARPLLLADPELGKKRLALELGIHPPMARCLKERFRGEQQEHRTDPTYQLFLKLKAQNPNWGASRVAQAMGIKHDIARLMLARFAGAVVHQAGSITPTATTVSPTPGPVTSPEEETLPPLHGAAIRDTTCGNLRDIDYRGANHASLEELLTHLGVNQSEWEVTKYEVRRWEPGARVGGELVTKQVCQFRVWFRRMVAEQQLSAMQKKFLDRIRQVSPALPPVTFPGQREGVLEVSLMDVHLGKQAWSPETGQRDYDADIAEQLFRDALKFLVTKGAVYQPARILFPCGNDFLNVDSCQKTTTSGTPQDEILRWQDSFVRGKALLVEAIQLLRQIAPVDVIMVPGNHDRQRTFELGEVLKAVFERTADVTVENSPATRKYYQAGPRNLIGFTHGNMEQHANLPMLMAQEVPKLWSEARHKEFHLGHWHKRRSKMFVPVEEQAGVLVRIIPSLCPADAWHAAMGFIGKLAAEAYYWHPEDGAVVTITHTPA